MSLLIECGSGILAYCLWEMSSISTTNVPIFVQILQIVIVTIKSVIVLLFFSWILFTTKLCIFIHSVHCLITGKVFFFFKGMSFIDLNNNNFILTIKLNTNSFFCSWLSLNHELGVFFKQKWNGMMVRLEYSHYSINRLLNICYHSANTILTDS